MKEDKLDLLPGVTEPFQQHQEVCMHGCGLLSAMHAVKYINESNLYVEVISKCVDPVCT